MTKSTLDTWVLSHFVTATSGENHVDELRHAVRKHWQIGKKNMMERACHGALEEVSSFEGISAEEIQALLMEVMSNKEDQILEWVNDPFEFSALALRANVGETIGLSLKNGRWEKCTTLCIILKKNEYTGGPYLATVYPTSSVQYKQKARS